MPFFRPVAAIAAIACALPAPAAHDPEHGLPAHATAAPPAAAEIMSLGLRGVHFIPNHGQWSDEEVHYGFKSQGLDIAFRESSLTMHLRRETPATSGKRQRPHDSPTAPAASGKRQRPHPEHGLPARGSDDRSALADPTRGCEDSAPAWEHLTLEVTFPGSNVVLPRAAKPQAARFNYYIGDDASRWASDVPSFGMIAYENLYDGIDLHVMGAACGFATDQTADCGFATPRILKYEFHCAPGADHTQIRIQYDGIDALCLDERTGDLLIETPFGTLRDTAPIAFSPRSMTGGEIDRSLTIPARFDVFDRHTYTIALDATPDPSLPLVIDPEIEWMYYLGGSGSDMGFDIAVDSADHALVTGSTASADFAGRNNSLYGGGIDAFALKVNPSGQLQWMTYLGGSAFDIGQGIAVDSAGNALVTGFTDSTDFAGQNNSNHGQWDAFALKVSPTGQLQWMTYLGGSNLDFGLGIAVDSAGNALVTGWTESTDFAGRNNSHYSAPDWPDAFALKVSPSGQLQWMTYLGGSGWDEGYGITVDSADNALVTGYTWSTELRRAEQLALRRHLGRLHRQTPPPRRRSAPQRRGHLSRRRSHPHLLGRRDAESAGGADLRAQHG